MSMPATKAWRALNSMFAGRRPPRDGPAPRSVTTPFAINSVSGAEAVRIPLASGWAIQSSAAVAAGGDAVSRPGFSVEGWHPASVPGTVVGALVDEGRFPNPYAGMNLRAMPGTTYPIGGQFA